jgi:hypothetical protein
MTLGQPGRRTVLLGGAASLGLALAAPPVRAVDRARRVFRILRDGEDIGTHSLEARLSPPGFEVTIEVDIAVTFLGFTAYRYTLRNHEVWADRRILEVDSTVNDDGDEVTVSVRRGGDGRLRIDGTDYAGEVSQEAVTTSYYAKPFLERRPWISTQGGRPLDVSISLTEGGTPAGWKVTGDLETMLYYDEAGEWVGCRFDASGAPAEYEVIENTGPIGAMWRRA